MDARRSVQLWLTTAMLSEPIGNLEDTGKIVCTPPQTSVAEAAALMLSNRVSAVLVVENDSLAGIFTEHDVVARVIVAGLDPAAVQLGDVMTRGPLTVTPETSLGHALVVMHEHGIRHLPVLRDGKPIGMVGARDALDPALEDFISEEVRRKSFL